MTSRHLIVRFGAVALACVTAAGSVRAQAAADSRWAAWTGCWQPVVQLRSPGPSAGLVCVTPTSGSSIEIAMVDSGRVLARDTVDASGTQRPFASQGCTGWRRGSWSKDGRRVYMRSELACAGGQTRTATGVFAVAESGDWIHVEGAAAAGNSGVRVVRYMPAGSWVAPELPADLTATLRAGTASPNDARMLAGTPIAAADIIEATKQLDTAVVQAWVMERGQPFELDGRKILALADAGVPGSVIDVMVGVSFPDRFALAPRGGGMRDTSEAARASAPRAGYGPAYGRMSCSTMWDPMWYPGSYDACGSRYGYSYGPGGYYGYGYGGYNSYNPYYGGYGYAPTIGIGGGFYPTTVVVVEKRDLPHGRAVNGEGYTRGGSGSDRGSQGSDHAAAAPSSPPPRQSTAGSSSGSSGSSSSGSSSSGRTAHKKGG